MCGCLLAPLSGITLTTRAIGSQHYILLRVRVRACLRVCVGVLVRACVCACVRQRQRQTPMLFTMIT